MWLDLMKRFVLFTDRVPNSGGRFGDRFRLGFCFRRLLCGSTARVINDWVLSLGRYDLVLRRYGPQIVSDFNWWGHSLCKMPVHSFSEAMGRRQPDVGGDGTLEEGPQS
jgi:hypothetical protein